MTKKIVYTDQVDDADHEYIIFVANGAVVLLLHDLEVKARERLSIGSAYLEFCRRKKWDDRLVALLTLK